MLVKICIKPKGTESLVRGFLGRNARKDESVYEHVFT